MRSHLLALALLGAVCPQATPKPNIILILADNLGCYDRAAKLNPNQ